MPLALLFIWSIFAGSVLAEGIWIDTDAEALREAGESAAIQMVKADYSPERSYIGVDAVIHFSANDVDYALYHIVDTFGGLFTLSTAGIEPYPYGLFGGETDPEAEAYFAAEDAARDAYFAWAGALEGTAESGDGY